MIKWLFSLYFFLVALLFSHAQTSNRNASYENYFGKYKDIAIQQMHEYGIPASITLAQGVLESGAGKSELAAQWNNHFGIKCNGWTGARTYHDDDDRNECFRAYDSAYESYIDHSRFLSTGSRYSRLFKLKHTDYKGWAKGLKACGYATSPTYASRLIDIIETYRLDRYDRQKSYDMDGILSLHGGPSHRQSEFNGNIYVTATDGDTFSSLAAELDMTPRTLARINETTPDAPLNAGDYVWLKKKRRKAPKEYARRPHIVSAGESMYSISQRYGIRLKNLYKINDLPPDFILHVGDTLRVR